MGVDEITQRVQKEGVPRTLPCGIPTPNCKLGWREEKPAREGGTKPATVTGKNQLKAKGSKRLLEEEVIRGKYC